MLVKARHNPGNAAMNSPSLQQLVETVKARFESHMHRHEAVVWTEVQLRLEADETALRSL